MKTINKQSSFPNFHEFLLFFKITFFDPITVFFVQIIIECWGQMNFWEKFFTEIFFISTHLRMEMIFHHIYFVHLIAIVTWGWEIPLKIKFVYFFLTLKKKWKNSRLFVLPFYDLSFWERAIKSVSIWEKKKIKFP
jgi:hypothetical protein